MTAARSSASPDLGPFGRRLRQWRNARGMSQLDLAIAAGTTPRHVSFVETGRSRPGRDLVLRLADVLAVLIAHRNELLAAAGLPPVYPEHELGSAALESVDRLLDRVLAGHEPYPAWVVRQPLTFVRANAAAQALLPGLCELSREQVVDLWFSPGPFRDRVRNWPEVVWAGVVSLRRDALALDGAEATALVCRAEWHARQVPGPWERADAGIDPVSPVMCPVFELDGWVVRTITAVLRFDTAVEVTVSRLRVELMFPADEETDAFFRRGLVP